MISKSEIEAIVTEMLRQDPWRMITPAQVYHELERRGRCCGCFGNVYAIILAQFEAFHRSAETPTAQVLPFIRQLEADAFRAEKSRRDAQQRKMAG